MLNCDLPVKLVPNKLLRYPGGREIDAFRGITPPMDDNRPEAWVGSTTLVGGAVGTEDTTGLAQAIAANGSAVFLRDVLVSQAEAIFGPRHIQACGADTGVLVKLLDAELQLGLQCHPSRQYARERFNFPYGKEECWYIISLREDSPETPYVYLGFREGANRAAFEAAFRRGDVPAMEAMCHKIPVHPGEMYYVGAGVPHAIGPGCFLLEVQEPSDITVGTGVPKRLQGQEAEAYLLRAVECYQYDGSDYEENLRRYFVEPKAVKENANGTQELLIGPAQTPYFSAARLRCTGPFTLKNVDSMAIAIVTKGAGTLRTAAGSVSYAKADEWLLPHQAGDITVEPEEETELLLSYPPSAIWD